MPKKYLLLFLIVFLPFGASWAQIASSEYVEQRMETTVSVTGEQEISGKKNYTVSPTVPTPELP